MLLLVLSGLDFTCVTDIRVVVEMVSKVVDFFNTGNFKLLV